MTAFPDQTGAVTAQAHRATLQGPWMAEHFWGLEVASAQGAAPLVLALRGAKAAVAVAAFALAFLVWLPPFAGLLAGAFAAKMVGCFAMLLAGAVMARAASRGAVVYVQLDIRNGEIREVTYDLFGHADVLARYGIDCVTGVCVKRSGAVASAGQVQIMIDGAGAIAAGTGPVSCLQPLRDRMREDLGVNSGEQPPAIWAGPRAG